MGFSTLYSRCEIGVFVFKDHNRWALWLAKNLNRSSASQLFQLGKGPSRASRGTVQLREGSLTAQHQPALHSSSLQQHPFGNISQITAIIDTGFLLNIVSMGPSSVHILHPTFHTHSHTHIAHEWWMVLCIKPSKILSVLSAKNSSLCATILVKKCSWRKYDPFLNPLHNTAVARQLLRIHPATSTSLCWQ